MGRGWSDFTSTPRGHVRLPSRPTRRRQNGTTLIEMIVTMALLAVGFVGIGAGIAATEKFAAINQDQSQLEVAMRQLADYVRDSSSTGLAYQLCAQVTTPVSAASAGMSTYTSTLPAIRPQGVTQWGFSAIYESTAGKVNGLLTSAMASFGCPAGTGDWGVQEIKLAVFDGTRSLTRIVWKSYAWCYQATTPIPTSC